MVSQSLKLALKSSNKKNVYFLSHNEIKPFGKFAMNTHFDSFLMTSNSSVIYLSLTSDKLANI